ncbi:3',5'-cyclic-AMP phosphodiesterase [Ferrimonas aestuarii]|uniref:3',5'-cyclic-AMP phosphodiesterase n=1 Tax=Ferrimonas aestuarii TaxID=2569539 RepID=A0A4U1BQB3_9GAMM|nr:3',5'-cyclic-AMP phosphodiesterase [Ferrimonas aestuarii]TKB56809.1 3',5'-cyclic-AMP phosphodiesterase [Ferrimonas aestuarii]
MSARTKVMLEGLDQETIRIAQLSDPHLLADKSADFLGQNPWDSFMAVLEMIASLNPHLLLVTGDISQDHTLTAYQHFAASVTQLGVPVASLPGNHDALVRMQSGFAGSGIMMNEQIDLGHWQLLQLDSTLPRVPAGALSEASLNWLDSTLGLSDKPTLVALHHHPIDTGCKWLDQHRLANGKELLKCVEQHNHVKGVVWGHVHQQGDYQLNQAQLMSVPSTSIQFKPQCDDFTLDTLQPGFRLLELHRDDSISSQVYRLPGERFLPDMSVSGY